MMQIDQDGVVRVAGFPKGLNNISPESSLPEGALLEAVNVDVLDGGKVRRRGGFVKKYAGNGIHSFWSKDGKTMFYEGGSLKLLNADLSATVLATGLMSNKTVAYANVNGEIYWSNGDITGKINSSGTNELWGIPMPTKPVATATAAGGLFNGIYKIALTFILDTGEEGGVDSFVYVTVTEGGGILLNGIPASPDVKITKIGVYVSAANGEVAYHYADIATGTSTLSISQSATLGRALNTQGYYPFPACELLDYTHGSLIGAIGRLLFYSSEMRYRLCRIKKNYIMFTSNITMIAWVNGGVYVSNETDTYFMRGNNLDKCEQIPLLPYPAVKGTLVRIPNSNDVAWFSARGWVKGDQQGNVTNVTEGSMLPDVFVTGAAGFREYNGVRQLVSSMTNSSETNNMIASDYVNIEVIRKAG